MRPIPRTRRLLYAAALLCAASLPVSAEVSPYTPMRQASPLELEVAAAVETEASGIEWMDQQDKAGFLATNSISNTYMAPASFSRAQSNDTLAGRLHLPRQVQDISLSSDYPSLDSRQREAEELDSGLISVVGLGMLTATISGILMYSRNPISRKRKYRRTPEERRLAAELTSL